MVESDSAHIPALHEHPALPASGFSEQTLRALGELEASLLGTQTAVLNGDLASLEHITHEQATRIKALQTMLEQANQPARREGAFEGPEATLSDGVRAAAAHVLQLGRIQMALLARVQRRLAILENVLAGPERSYAPAPRGAASGFSRSRLGGSRCRV